jgi:hypothetical protein
MNSNIILHSKSFKINNALTQIFNLKKECLINNIALTSKDLLRKKNQIYFIYIIKI